MARFSLSPPTSSSVRRRQQQQQQSSSSASSPAGNATSATTTVPQWKWNFPPQDQYYRPSQHLEDDSSSSGSSSSSSEDISTYQSYGTCSDSDNDDDDDDEEEEEPPHPMGFESRYGKTRFGLSPSQSTFTTTTTNPNPPMRDIFDREDEYAWNALIHIDADYHNHDDYNEKHHSGEQQQQQGGCQSFPPIKSYHLSHSNVVSTSKLLLGAQGSQSSKEHEGNSMDDILFGMDRIANLVKAANSCYVHEDHSSNHNPQRGNESLSTPRGGGAAPFSQSQQQQPRSTSKLLQLASLCSQQQSTLSSQMSQLQTQKTIEYQQSCQGFLLLLQADAARVNTANDRIIQREEEVEAVEEQERLDQLAYEAQLQQQREDEGRMEGERLAAREALTEHRRIKQLEKAEQLARAEHEAEEEAALKTRHVSRATSLIANLDTVRATLGEFDKSKSVSKRRLQFKKIVNGKINTLSHDANKVVEVGRMVMDAMHDAANDDAANSGGEAAVQSMGKRYLLDLLCANLIVRVQADGFTGTRGDGFPLASMFAFVSTRCEEIGPVLEGHLYTVCPTAIPTLSLTPMKDGGDENDLMESLGMLRDTKSGEFESFDKFLHRTEGLISIMADIMSSLPSDHTLLGGHLGALTWLQRFMDLLPPAPTSPLPLLTAPVLVAFLTGAGHMLANKYPTEFKLILDHIKNDVEKRLDESAVGVPSATRLKRVLEDVGYGGLKKDLPQGAVKGLYDGQEGTGTAAGIRQVRQTPPSSSASDFGHRTQSSHMPASTTSAFGQQASSEASSSGGGASNAFSSSNWGNTSSADSVFGVSSTASTAPMDNTTTPSSSSAMPGASSPFGGGFGSGATGAAPSPFGGNQSAGFVTQAANTNVPATAGFAPAAAVPMSSGFAPAAPSPFGGGQSADFGMAPPAAAAAPSPFGGGGGQSSGFGMAPQQAAGVSAFGTAHQPAPSPFGTTPAAPAHSPFGTAPAATAPGPSQFGAAPSPFGSTPAPPAAGGFGQQQQMASSGFGASPFGGTAAPGPSPFGGGGMQQQQQQGGGAFGSGGMQHQQQQGGGAFGGSGGMQQGGVGGGSKKPPCKFFSQGKCNFGDRCKFSHDLGGSGQQQQQQGGPSPFGGAPGGGQQQGGGAFGGQGSGGGGGASSKKKPCRFFAQGKCNYGDRCQFSHDLGGGGGQGQQQGGGPSPFGGAPGGGQQQGGSKPPCKFFAQGNCQHGTSCRFSHDLPGGGGGGGGGNTSGFGGGGGGGFGQSTGNSNPSPFSGGGGGGGFGGSSPFGSTGSAGFGASPFGGPRR